MIGAVGKVAVGAATGAVSEHGDSARGQTGFEQLTPVGFGQVEVQAGAQAAVARRAGGEEEQRVFFPDRVRVINIAEQIIGVGELRDEFAAHFFADGVAALSDAGADGGDQIFGAAAELQVHATHSIFNDSLQSSAPASMEGGDGAIFAVGDENGDAVGRLDGEQEARFGGHEAVTLGARLELGGAGDGYPADERGVNLAQGDNGIGGVSGDFVEETAAVFKDGFARVGGCEAQVQLAGSLAGIVNRGDAAGSGAESAEEPVDFGEEWGAEDFDAALDRTGGRTLWVGKPAGMLWLALEAGGHELATAVAKANGGEKLIDFRCGGIMRSGHSSSFYFSG